MESGNDTRKRKFLHVKVNKVNSKLQLEYSDISICDADIRKKNCETLGKSSKIARGMIGETLHFIGEMWSDGKACRAKIFKLKNSTNLFGTEWMYLTYETFP